MSNIAHKLACLIAVLASANAIAQTNNFVERPNLKVGDSWSFQRTDLWKNERVAGLAKRAVADFVKRELGLM